MIKQELVKYYDDILLRIKEFRKSIKNENKFIHKKSIREEAEVLCNLWFDKQKSHLSGFGIPKQVIDNYDSEFKELLRLSSSHNLKSSYEKIISNIISSFHETLVLQLKTSDSKSGIKFERDNLLSKVKNSDENNYLKESIECFESGYQKAAIVLGWCATIHKIHLKIESIGFDNFNKMSTKLAEEKNGRFKRFNKKYSINSIGELSEVFDNDILWIIEGFELIDSNQHTRLKSCFDMRNHSAHPGEAPITEYNVLSFFSDVIEIVLSNDKFS